MSVEENVLQGKTVGFIGGGNMAKAIGRGLLHKGVLKSSQIWVSAPSKSNLEDWKKYQVSTTHDNQDIFNVCDIIIFACKPHQLSKALSLSTEVETSKLYVSILVGVSCETIKNLLTNTMKVKSPRVIRTMPNVACAVGEGSTVITPDSSASTNDVSIVVQLFSALGRCEVIPENLMESVAALTGSGPAYIFMVIEAMADGAVKHGVPREMAYTLAAQTALGASKLVLETKKHPGQLKDEVCSPGGTTICAVHELEKGNLRGVFMNAIEGAVLKAKSIFKGST